VWLLLAVVAQAGELGGVVVRGGQPVGEAIVYLDAVAVRRAAAPLPATVEFQQRRLQPRALVGFCGGELILQNADPMLHVVRVESLSRSNGATTLARVAMPYAGFEKRLALPDCREPQLLRVVGENGEERQRSYLAVVPHPWATVTGADGRFVLGELPPGRYRVCVWHEQHGVLAQEVKLSPGRPLTVALQFPAKP
jgi:hypothetical protein